MSVVISGKRADDGKPLAINLFLDRRRVRDTDASLPVNGMVTEGTSGFGIPGLTPMRSISGTFTPAERGLAPGERLGGTISLEITKMKGEKAADLLIAMKLHDAGDEDIKQFQNKYALRISAWFGAYDRAVTKSHERTLRVGRVEETAEALLRLDADMAKKPKGPPKKKLKVAGASGIDVAAGPAAATMAVAVIGLTTVATVKKRRSRPGKQKPVASDRGAAGAVELPSDALPCPNGADDGMMATDAPREAPNPVKKPKKKKAKTTGAEGGGAAGVPVPPSAALGMPDVTASMLPALVPTSRTGRRGAGQNRNHGRLPTSTASAARPTPGMSAYDEIRAIEAAARRGT